MVDSISSEHKEGGVLLARPNGLPPFVAFAASHPSDPLPELTAAEEQILGASAVASRHESLRRGRAAAHEALHAIGRDDGSILQGPNREPLWPAGVVGSISHSGGYAIAIVAPLDRTDGVGIDIEQLTDVPELLEHVPTDSEAAFLNQLDPELRTRESVALFSAKESIYKAFFPRVNTYFGFERASLVRTNTGYSASLVTGTDAEYPSDRRFPVTVSWHGDLVVTHVVLPKTGTPRKVGAS